MSRIWLLTASCVCVAGIAWCAADDVDAERLEAARALAGTMNLQAQLMIGFEAMSPVIDQQTQLFKLSADESAELRKIYRDWFEQDIDRAGIERKIIAAYAAEFTASELRELDQFYRSPLGQKLLQSMPKLTQQGAKFGMEAAQAQQGKLIERLEPFFKQRAQR